MYGSWRSVPASLVPGTRLRAGSQRGGPGRVSECGWGALQGTRARDVEATVFALAPTRRAVGVIWRLAPLTENLGRTSRVFLFGCDAAPAMAGSDRGGLGGWLDSAELGKWRSQLDRHGFSLC